MLNKTERFNMLNESDLQARKAELTQLIGAWAEEKKILLPGETIEIDVRIVSAPKVRIEITSSTDVDGMIVLLAKVLGVRTDQIEYESLASVRSALQKALSSLSEREAKVLDVAFGLNQPAIVRRKDQAAKFDLSGSRIHQIQAKALRKMRHPTRIRLLEQVVNTKFAE